MTRTICLATVLLLALASATPAAESRRPGFVQLEGELRRHATTLEASADNGEKKLAKRVRKALKRLARSTGDLKKDAKILRRVASILKSIASGSVPKADSPEEVQMHLLIFGVVAQTIDDADGIAAGLQSVVAAAEGEVPERKRQGYVKRLTKALEKLDAARALCNNENITEYVNDATAAKAGTLVGNPGKAILSFTKEVDKSTTPLMLLARRVDKLIAKNPELGGTFLVPLPLPTGALGTSAVVQFQVALPGGGAYPLAATHVSAHVPAASANPTRTINIVAVLDGCRARLVRIRLSGAAAAEGFTGTVQADGTPAAQARILTTTLRGDSVCAGDFVVAGGTQLNGTVNITEADTIAETVSGNATIQSSVPVATERVTNITLNFEKIKWTYDE